MQEFSFRPIGYIRSPYSDASEVPKGLGAQHKAEGTLEVLPEFEPGLLDIEGFSHLYILWVFDRAEGSELIATPPTDNKQHGVFSTRSPQRPNPIGLTVVELVGREGAALKLRGVDMLEGTPVLDIKPYLSSIPADQLRRGWLAEAEQAGSAVRFLTPAPWTECQSQALEAQLSRRGSGARVSFSKPDGVMA